MKNIREFVKEHDIQAHLQAAVDDQSSGDWSAFEGLQDGEAIVTVRWDGVRASFTAFHPPAPKYKAPEEKPVEPMTEETQPQDAPKPRKKRES